LPHPGDWKDPILGAVFVIVAFGGLYTFARYLVMAGFKIAWSIAPRDLRNAWRGFGTGCMAVPAILYFQTDMMVR
jgi:hypothetical protein